ncbi:MAG: p-hydroxycinnamoyl CoA hydratase/lyase [Betaproteobacteria bacterium RIFCSPLOWO2_02_FULL_63_19]|nr:MAG: p-hydroxycinnamoyl CoA hydratase/lyase [Betaproteobacteria bacterium RIFCSPLOWO2_02_FULL_63_19]
MSQSDNTAIPGGKLVLVEFEDGIAWVTLNRPEKRNAISPKLSDEMLSVMNALECDERCRCLVITGAGDSYSAGMDLKEFFRETDRLDAEHKAAVVRSAAEWQWRRLMYYMKPSIAMVNGWCFGGAFNSLVACDLAIAAEEATFGLSEINWGIIPAGNVLKAVSAVMNQRDALYYTMTGETFDGRKAAHMGLVNEAVPRARLRERTRELAKVLISKNPTAMRTAKHACKRVRSMDWEDSQDYLFAKLEQMQFLDPEKGRASAMSQFLDKKTFRPGLQNYERGR